MRLEIPKLRLWHLLGLIAAGAAFFSVMRFRQETEEPVYRWIRQLRSVRAAERHEAVLKLGQNRRRERRAIAPLMEALFDSDAKVRVGAARALSWLVRDDKDPEFETVKAALTSRLSDPDPGARLAIAIVLAQYQAEAGLVVPTLLGFVGDGDSMARSEALNGLSGYARQSEPTRRAVFHALDDPDLRVRVMALHALRSCSAFPTLAPQPLLGTIIAAFEEATSDESPVVRGLAVNTLGNLASLLKVDNRFLLEALDDPDSSVRLQAASSLGWRGAAIRSPDLLPALGRTLLDKEASVRRASARALGWIGSEVDSEAVLTLLRASADDPDQDTRYEITGAIEKINGETGRFRSKILPDTIAELGDADPIVRALAAHRLQTFGRRAGDAVPALVRCLGDREAEVRLASAQALGCLGASTCSVSALADVADSDDDERVRRAASSARSNLLGGEEGGGAQAP